MPVFAYRSRWEFSTPLSLSLGSFSPFATCLFLPVDFRGERKNCERGIRTESWTTDEWERTFIDLFYRWFFQSPLSLSLFRSLSTSLQLRRFGSYRVLTFSFCSRSFYHHQFFHSPPSLSIQFLLSIPSVFITTVSHHFFLSIRLKMASRQVKQPFIPMNSLVLIPFLLINNQVIVSAINPATNNKTSSPIAPFDSDPISFEAAFQGKEQMLEIEIEYQIHFQGPFYRFLSCRFNWFSNQISSVVKCYE